MLQLIFILQSLFFYHDVAVANFEIDQVNSKLIMNVKMDKEDLESVYLLKNDENIDLTNEINLVQNYLDQNFYLVINKEKINFNIKGISKDKYFYSIDLESQNKVEEIIHHIQLKNTCLLKQVDKHSNIVSFQINDKFRMFRMHEGRVRIELRY